LKIQPHYTIKVGRGGLGGTSVKTAGTNATGKGLNGISSKIEFSEDTRFTHLVNGIHIRFNILKHLVAVVVQV
jgi:hypothetical protein